jgi:hypothetical protein
MEETETFKYYFDRKMNYFYKIVFAIHPDLERKFQSLTHAGEANKNGQVIHTKAFELAKEHFQKLSTEEVQEIEAKRLARLGHEDEFDDDEELDE